MYATKGLLFIGVGLVMALTSDQCQAAMNDAVDGVQCTEDQEEPNRLICTCNHNAINDTAHHVSAHNKKNSFFSNR